VSTPITWDIRVSDISSATNECAVSNKYYNYYLVGDKRIIPTDRFYQYSNDVKINTWQSLIKIWRWNWVLNDCDNWSLLSNVVPNKNILAWWAYIWKSDCTLKIPNYTKTDSSQVDAQINYTVWYHDKINSWGTMISWKFYYKDNKTWWDYFKCYDPYWLETNTLDSCNTTGFRYGSVKQHTWECINFRVFRCGDGLVNWYNWTTNYANGDHIEQCDPNDPNHTNWWLYGCTETCEKNDVPPVVQPAPTCNITLSSNEISLWESATINYQISWAFNSPTYMEVTPSFIQWAFSYTIYCNTANNCQFTQW